MREEHPYTVGYMYDSFIHKGPNGNHVCMIFDEYGSDLLKLRNFLLT